MNTLLLFRQLGNRGPSRLVPLVQGLSHQINLFLVEYNKYNHLQLNLPGFRLRRFALAATTSPDPASASSFVMPPEEVLHQQRLLLQSCDRLKLSVSRHAMLQTNLNNNGGRCTISAHHQSPSQSESAVVDAITQLGATFTRLIELMLSKEIKASKDTGSVCKFQAKHIRKI